MSIALVGVVTSVIVVTIVILGNGMVHDQGREIAVAGQWGEPHKGLRCRILAERPVLADGMIRLWLQMEFENVSSDPVKINLGGPPKQPPLFWFSELERDGRLIFESEGGDYDERWNGRATIPPGQKARFRAAKLFKPPLYASLYARGVLLRLKLHCYEAPDSGYGDILSGSISLPSAADIQ